MTQGCARNHYLDTFISSYVLTTTNIVLHCPGSMTLNPAAQKSCIQIGISQNLLLLHTAVLKRLKYLLEWK